LLIETYNIKKMEISWWLFKKLFTIFAPSKQKCSSVLSIWWRDDDHRPYGFCLWKSKPTLLAGCEAIGKTSWISKPQSITIDAL